MESNKNTTQDKKLIRIVNSPLRVLLFIRKHRLMGKVKRISRKNSEILFLTGRSRLEK